MASSKKARTTKGAGATATKKDKIRDFVSYWTDRGNEKGGTQKFWIDLIRLLGVEDTDAFIDFEKPCLVKQKGKRPSKGYIDVYLPKTKVLIEQKKLSANLDASYKQSDGESLTPYEQADRYNDSLKCSEKSHWIVVCNFAEFRVYDMEAQKGVPEIILLENLEKELYRLKFLVDSENPRIKRETEVSVKAGVIVGKLYNKLIKQYENPEDSESLRSLNMLCVRLVFCLYAEDSDVFGAKGMFHDYMNEFNKDLFRTGLINLFKVLDQKSEERSPYLSDKLAAFPYVNGGLFADKNIEIPKFTDEIRNIILIEASENFNWSEISPTIFGSIFESTLNPVTRQIEGMHYTSIENIHKAIDPLFLDDLKAELDAIKKEKTLKTRAKKAKEFQNKLAKMKFFDPACGSGNFLTETFLSLRRLENEAISIIYNGQRIFGEIIDPVKVSINQFYGIEINDFAVSVAKTALWIAESQMLAETSRIIQKDIEFLPLRTNATIIEGNALRIDWEKVVPKEELSYIIGNPPFVGARIMSKAQKNDVSYVFKDTKCIGDLDYVSCWFQKSAEMIADTPIRVALVSTNSITQGAQVSIVWNELFKRDITILFAHRTFRWDNEAQDKAHVHCVIIGFAVKANIPKTPKILYDGGKSRCVSNINPYLIDAPDILVQSRNTPICKVPEIRIGNKPIDNGIYLFEEDEMKEFIKLEPKSKPLFKLWYGSEEYINQKPRYCLWLGDLTPAELGKLPYCLKRAEAVRKYRLNSRSKGTRKIADKPTRFHVESMPKTTYIVVPEASSKGRYYIPMGFMGPNVFCSNLVKIIPNGTLYHLGVLTSSVHMAWMRAICGRLKSDYRYSKEIVYNNFPWPKVKKPEQERIEQTAQAILDARALYPDSTLADMYDERRMPKELRKAHAENDKAVCAAFRFPKNITLDDELGIAIELLRRYEKLQS